MSLSLEYTIIIFLIAIIIILGVLCYFTAKLLQKTTETMVSIKMLTDVTRQELQPALKTFNNVLKTVDNVSVITNKQFDIIKNIFTAVLGAACVAFTNTRNKGGFFSGLVSGFNLFKKRR